MSRVSKKTRRGGGSRTRRRTRRMNGRTNTGVPPRDSRREISSDLFVDDGRLRRIPSDLMNERFIVPDQTQHLTLQFLNTRISNELNDLRQHIRKLEDDIKELKLNNLPTDAVSPHAVVPREEYPIGNDLFESLMNHPRRAWA
tara:strand:- start:1467 stop:1895 length:429 start_codon:yes stop_codon:yes gene_type:complete